MKKVCFAFIAVFMFAFHSAHAEIITVPYVDPARYLGDWYQISHKPMFFEGGVCACARQRLTPGKTADAVKVYNSCNSDNPQGRLRSISGVATIDDPQSNSKLTVDFGLPWKGTYWIIGLDSEYRYAVVTDKDGDALYILSKTPSLESNLYNEAVDAAVKQKINISKLEMTVQTGCSYPN